MTDQQLEQLKELAQLACYAQSFAIPADVEFKHIDWQQVLNMTPEERLKELKG